ncbi:MAG: sigma factor [Bacillota bacterium]
MQRKPQMVNAVLTSKMIGKVEHEPVESRVARARGGDIQARDDLIRDYIPFILKTASSCVRRYVTLGEDDEASVALSAFNEAIDAFKSTRPGFLAFSSTVIKRRLVDHFRKQARHREIPFSTLNPYEGGHDSRWDPSCLAYSTKDWQDCVERRDDIENWKEALREFGLTLGQVIASTPKHKDARKRAMLMAGIIAQNDELKASFFGTRQIPVDELLSLMPKKDRVSKKTVDRQKVYITAVAIAMSGDYPSLEGFLEVSD